MSSASQINRDLCQVLGIDPTDVRAVNVKIRPGTYPTVFVQTLLRDPVSANPVIP